MYFNFQSVAHFLGLNQNSINFIASAAAVANPSTLNGYNEFVTDFETALAQIGFQSPFGTLTPSDFARFSTQRPSLNNSSQEIIDVANELFATHNTLTTLEVKEELRKRNYWVTQRTVSEALNNAASSQDWSYYDNGTYRVYTSNNIAPVQSLPAPTASTQVITPTAPVNNYGKTKIADWTCFNGNNMNQFKVYKNMTRNQAVARFSAEHGVRYIDVKPRIVK